MAYYPYINMEGFLMKSHEVIKIGKNTAFFEGSLESDRKSV